MFRSLISESPLGTIYLEASNLGLTKLIIGYSESASDSQRSAPLLLKAEKQIRSYLSGDLQDFTIPLDLKGLTFFQREILTLTRSIPYGEFRSYGYLAKQVNKPGASQAVGMVMKKNPLPIIIPCHRVVASDGKLHGYSAAGGLLTKTWLLELEGLKIVDQRLV
jgi:methylated-DNA-[protein]-cysteine S-methyltransferase